jgi:hypothetical protein
MYVLRVFFARARHLVVSYFDVTGRFFVTSNGRWTQHAHVKYEYGFLLHQCSSPEASDKEDFDGLDNGGFVKSGCS